MNQPSGFDASIPVLTEVLHDAAEAAQPRPAAAPPAVLNHETPFIDAPAPAPIFSAPVSSPYFSATPMSAPAPTASPPPPATSTPDYMHTAIPAAAYGAAAAALHDRGAVLEAEAGARWDEQDWQTLELRLSERILHQLQGRIDFVLEQRIKDGIFEVVSRALGQLSNDIRGGVQHTVEQAVAAAVAHELAQLRTQKNRY